MYIYIYIYVYIIIYIYYYLFDLCLLHTTNPLQKMFLWTCCSKIPKCMKSNIIAEADFAM